MEILIISFLIGALFGVIVGQLSVWKYIERGDYERKIN